jgi:hypothetical protein
MLFLSYSCTQLKGEKRQFDKEGREIVHLKQYLPLPHEVNDFIFLRQAIRMFSSESGIESCEPQKFNGQAFVPNSQVHSFSTRTSGLNPDDETVGTIVGKGMYLCDPKDINCPESGIIQGKRVKRYNELVQGYNRLRDLHDRLPKDEADEGIKSFNLSIESYHEELLAYNNRITLDTRLYKNGLKHLTSPSWLLPDGEWAEIADLPSVEDKTMTALFDTAEGHLQYLESVSESLQSKTIRGNGAQRWHASPKVKCIIDTMVISKMALTRYSAVTHYRPETKVGLDIQSYIHRYLDLLNRIHVIYAFFAHHTQSDEYGVHTTDHANEYFKVDFKKLKNLYPILDKRYATIVLQQASYHAKRLSGPFLNQNDQQVLQKTFETHNYNSSFHHLVFGTPGTLNGLYKKNLYLLKISREHMFNYEYLQLIRPRTIIDYKKLLKLSAVREMMINTWSVNRMDTNLAGEDRDNQERNPTVYPKDGIESCDRGNLTFAADDGPDHPRRKGLRKFPYYRELEAADDYQTLYTSAVDDIYRILQKTPLLGSYQKALNQIPARFIPSFVEVETKEEYGEEKEIRLNQFDYSKTGVSKENYDQIIDKLINLSNEQYPILIEKAESKASIFRKNFIVNYFKHTRPVIHGAIRKTFGLSHIDPKDISDIKLEQIVQLDNVTSHVVMEEDKYITNGIELNLSAYWGNFNESRAIDLPRVSELLLDDIAWFRMDGLFTSMITSMRPSNKEIKDDLHFDTPYKLDREYWRSLRSYAEHENKFREWKIYAKAVIDFVLDYYFKSNQKNKRRAKLVAVTNTINKNDLIKSEFIKKLTSNSNLMKAFYSDQKLNPHNPLFNPKINTNPDANSKKDQNEIGLEEINLPEEFLLRPKDPSELIDMIYQVAFSPKFRYFGMNLQIDLANTAQSEVIPLKQTFNPPSGASYSQLFQNFFAQIELDFNKRLSWFMDDVHENYQQAVANTEKASNDIYRLQVRKDKLFKKLNNLGLGLAESDSDQIETETQKIFREIEAARAALNSAEQTKKDAAARQLRTRKMAIVDDRYRLSSHDIIAAKNKYHEILLLKSFHTALQNLIKTIIDSNVSKSFTFADHASLRRTMNYSEFKDPKDPTSLNFFEEFYIYDNSPLKTDRPYEQQILYQTYMQKYVSGLNPLKRQTADDLKSFYEKNKDELFSLAALNSPQGILRSIPFRIPSSYKEFAEVNAGVSNYRSMYRVNMQHEPIDYAISKSEFKEKSQLQIAEYSNMYLIKSKTQMLFALLELLGFGPRSYDTTVQMDPVTGKPTDPIIKADEVLQKYMNLDIEKLFSTDGKHDFTKYKEMTVEEIDNEMESYIDGDEDLKEIVLLKRFLSNAYSQRIIANKNISRAKLDQPMLNSRYSTSEKASTYTFSPGLMAPVKTYNTKKKTKKFSEWLVDEYDINNPPQSFFVKTQNVREHFNRTFSDLKIGLNDSPYGGKNRLKTYCEANPNFPEPHGKKDKKFQDLFNQNGHLRQTFINTSFATSNKLMAYSSTGEVGEKTQAAIDQNNATGKNIKAWDHQLYKRYDRFKYLWDTYFESIIMVIAILAAVISLITLPVSLPASLGIGATYINLGAAIINTGFLLNFFFLAVNGVRLNRHFIQAPEQIKAHVTYLSLDQLFAHEVKLSRNRHFTTQKSYIDTLRANNKSGKKQALISLAVDTFAMGAISLRMFKSFKASGKKANFLNVITYFNAPAKKDVTKAVMLAVGSSAFYNKANASPVSHQVIMGMVNDPLGDRIIDDKAIATVIPGFSSHRYNYDAGPAGRVKDSDILKEIMSLVRAKRLEEPVHVAYTANFDRCNGLFYPESGDSNNDRFDNPYDESRAFVKCLKEPMFTFE